jgi:hypothetical protein
MINLFNEVGRVLGGGGIFDTLTPHLPHWSEVYRDPTHVSVWTEQTWDYLARPGSMVPLARHHGLWADLEVVRKEWRRGASVRGVAEPQARRWPAKVRALRQQHLRDTTSGSNGIASRARLEAGRVDSAQVSLSIIIPTAGRPTLAATLETLARQLHADDQVLVVGDGEQLLARELVGALPTPPWRYFEHGPTRDTGRSQREFAIARATGDYLCFMDDDDVFTDGALDTIRAHARAHPGRPLMFRMEDRFGTILWQAPEVAYANVSGHMLVVPNLAGKVGHWDKNDFEFIVQTLDLQGEPVWLEDVIAVLRPHLPRPSATG